jgi:sodium-dependent dicarboxylate transporter 2/3/5
MTDSTVEDVSNLDRSLSSNIGLVLGPAIFTIMIVAGYWQTTMPPEAWSTAAVGLWMAIWWATEAVPVPVTAFLPIITFNVLGVASLRESTTSYAHPIIYLFLGAFILALAVERWNLHKRVALIILSHSGTEGARLIGGFMIVSAFLSMWMTNTTTTMMLMPIAISVVKVICDNNTSLSELTRKNFQIAMLLALAYAATIGGLSTLIGTPPNALLAAFLADNYDIQISFASWMMVGVPVMLIMLPITWVLLTKKVYKIDIPASDVAHQQLLDMKAKLGALTTPEKRVAVLFVLVVLMWVIRRPLAAFFNLEGLTDAGIVMTAAMLLFLIPSGHKSGSPLMTWHDVNRLPWGVLVLFGGGLSLAAAVSSSGLAVWLGEGLAPLSIFGTITLIVAATFLVIFLTELTSNLATAATFLPVMGAIALELGISPLLLCVPVTLAASCAFMLPVATPPNAIVFASGMITIPNMIKAGVWLNFIGMIILSAVAIWWAPYIFSV